MKLNEAVIPHFRSRQIPIGTLKSRVAISENLLKQKPSWYDIEGKLQYFKIRDDFRLFSELFFTRFAKRVMELDTLDYHVANVRTISSKVSQSKEVSEVGLLSTNFQDVNYNHYLVGELMRAEISDFVAYGGYSLSNLLAFFKDYLANDDYKANELFLIKLFISDAFTFQADRNHNNISFRIPKIDGISYRDRLHIDRLVRNNCGDSAVEYNSELGTHFLKGLSPNLVFDSERILGISKSSVSYNKNDCWIPAFPYSNEVNLKKMNKDEVKEIQNTQFDGMDPNLVSLYCD